jgi:hypothetical protein
MQCHWGPRLTDDAFHNTRIPTGGAGDPADRGRIDGFAAWSESEFRADGVWSDSKVTRQPAAVADGSTLWPIQDAHPSVASRGKRISDTVALSTSSPPSPNRTERAEFPQTIRGALARENRGSSLFPRPRNGDWCRSSRR